MTSSCDPMTAVVECADEGGSSGGGGGGWSFFGYNSSLLYDAPGDPAPGSAGVWLGSSVSPSACFTSGGGAVTGDDVDGDGLANACEFPIARSFAPLLHYYTSEDCPRGEPYWAARRTGYNTVRAVYLLAYYEDCGYGAHAGDAEAVVVDVAYNYSTGHWQFQRMWTSAHFQGGEGCSDWYNWRCDFSEWSSASQTNFSARALAFPSVWVAKDKHANYRNKSRCEDAVGNSVIGFDDKCGDTYRVRTPVHEERNVGSIHVDLLGCVGSLNRGDSYGRTECFFTDRDAFRGWTQTWLGSDKSAGKYVNLLIRQFEYDW
jgi:hypothetical protein